MIKLLTLLNEVISQPKAIFLVGPAASGKSTVSKMIFPPSIQVINVDDAYEEALKSSGLGTNIKDFDSEKLSKAASLMAQARKDTKDKYSKHTSELKDIIIDGTGESIKVISSKKEELEKLGYKTFMVMTYVSPMTSLERNKNRERSLLPQIVLRSWAGVVSNINDFKQLFNDNFVLVNTSMKGEDNNEFNVEKITKQYFDTAKFQGKPKSKEDEEKSKLEKNELNKKIQYLLQNTPKFDSHESAKQKINNFLK